MSLCKRTLIIVMGIALSPVTVAAADGSKCIEFTRVSRSEVIDDSTVVVSLPRKQYRKITLQGPCHNLKSRNSFDAGKDPVCPGDGLTARGERDYCVIADIVDLDEPSAKDLMGSKR